MDLATLRRICLGFGAVYLLVGLLGFIPGITDFEEPSGAIPLEGTLLGLFGVNLVHDIAHLAIGAALIWAGLGDLDRIATVNKALAVLFVVLAVGSFIPPLIGLANLNMADAILHLLSAAVTGYLGFVAPRQLTGGARV